MRGDRVQSVRAGRGVDDADEVVALAEAEVEAVAVAEGEVAAVGRPAGPAGQTARAERRRQHPFRTGREVPDDEPPAHVEAGEPFPVGRERGMHPAAGGERGLLAGGQISPVHAEQPVAVVRVQQ